MNDRCGVYFLNAFEYARFQFVEGLDPDMAQETPRHLAEQSLDNVRPGAMFRREDVVEAVRML